MRNYGIHSSGCMTLDILGGANGVMFKNLKHKGCGRAATVLRAGTSGLTTPASMAVNTAMPTPGQKRRGRTTSATPPPHLCCWGIYRKRIQYSREHRNNETISGRLLSYFSEGSLVLYSYPLQVTTPLLQQAKWTNDNMDAIPVLW